MSQTPATERASAPTLTAAMVGHVERHRSARLVCRIPADTRPTIAPDWLRTGATARIDGPRVPVYTSLNVSPRRAGSMVPMYSPPIWVGSVCVNLIRSGDMIVMNAMSVWLRTASVTGCRISVALPDSMAAAVEGESGHAC